MVFRDGWEVKVRPRQVGWMDCKGKRKKILCAIFFFFFPFIFKENKQNKHGFFCFKKNFWSGKKSLPNEQKSKKNKSIDRHVFFY